MLRNGKITMVEAGGVEPPSANIPRKTSTGLDQAWVLAALVAPDQAQRGEFANIIS